MPLTDRRTERRGLLIAAAVEAALERAGDTDPDRTRAGIVAVLRFSSEDPRRGRILFTDARANPVLAERRLATKSLLFEMVVVAGGRQSPDTTPWQPASARRCTPARWSSSPSSG